MTGLPPATPTFIGRDTELTTLLDTLTPSPDPASPTTNPPTPTTVLIAAIGGMGGIGKTELTLQAAHTALQRGWFPGGVLFTDMRGYDPDPALHRDPGQALDGLLRAVGVPGEQIPLDTQDRARLLRSVLAAYVSKRRRVLVVIDNVSASEQAQPLVPSDGACVAIVTSRHVLADLDARLLNLDTLPTQQAIALLKAALRLRDPADSRILDHPDDAEQLTELCAGLPLALQIVAAQLAANTAKPLAAMAADLDDAESRLREMTFANRTVHAVFETSYQKLSGEQARLFRLLSLNPGPDISTPAVTALTNLSEAEARRGLEALARAHLVEPGGVYGRWRMHDLIRLHSAHHAFAEADIDQLDQALSNLLDYYLTTVRAANADIAIWGGDGDRVLSLEQAHKVTQALEWLDTEYLNLATAADTAAALGHPAIASELRQALQPLP